MALGSSELRVRGLTELNKALRQADRDVRVGIRKTIREVVEPVRAEAEENAAREISHLGPDWRKMRVGITKDTVYVAPRQRGTKDPRLKRPNLAPLLGEQMEAALDHNAEEVERNFDHMLDDVADRFGR